MSQPTDLDDPGQADHLSNLSEILCQNLFVTFSEDEETKTVENRRKRNTLQLRAHVLGDKLLDKSGKKNRRKSTKNDENKAVQHAPVLGSNLPGVSAGQEKHDGKKKNAVRAECLFTKYFIYSAG